MSKTTYTFTFCAVSCPRPSLSSKKLRARSNIRSPWRRAEASSRTSSLRSKATGNDRPSKVVSRVEATGKGDDVVVKTSVSPSIMNDLWLRTTAVVGTVLFASYYFKKPFPNMWLRVVHFFAFAAWFGSSLWAMVLSPKVMFTTVDRQTYSRLQVHLYPQFFGFTALTIVLLLGTSPFAGVPVTLLVALFSTLVNSQVMMPYIIEKEKERYAPENAEHKDAAKSASTVKESNQYYPTSTLLAIVATICCVAHGYRLVWKMFIHSAL